ncbi:MAG: serine/threonine-protein kinase [Planctomycetota bacterium]
MGEPETDGPASVDDRELELAIDTYERVGPEALEHWLRRRGLDSGDLLERIEALRTAELLREPPREDLPEHIGRYRVLRRLGAGAMGVVLLGIDDELNRLVAIKLLTPELAAEERLRERFRREARTVAGLQHGGIVPVLDAGEAGGQLYSVLEYVGGTTLAEGLTRLRDLTDGDPLRAGVTELRDAFRLADVPAEAQSLGRLAARWTLQLAEALAAAHGAGVVHRDVKPSNVMIDEDGRARLLDFGLAHVTDEARVTWTGDVLGTPRYLAPEVVRQGTGRADHRVDLFALGACLYELLTLAPAFDAISAAQVLQQILELDPPPPSRANAEVSRDLDAVVLVALAKEPSRRYLSARAMADDLARQLAGEPVQARTPGVLARCVALARRRPVAAGLTAALALVLVAGVGVTLVYNARLRERTVQAERSYGATESALGFLQELLELSDVEEQGPDVPARTLLVEGAARVRDDARWEAGSAVRPRLARILGALSWGAGDLEAADEILALSEELLARPPAEGVDEVEWSLELGRASNYRGNVLRGLGRRDEALASYRGALAATQGRGEGSRDLEATILANLADLLGELWRLPEAERYALRTLELCVGDDEETIANRAWALIALSRLQVRAHKLDEAQASIEEAQQVAARMSARPFQEAMVLDAAAMLAGAMKKHGHAAELLESSAAIYERTVGPDSTLLGETLISLGGQLHRAGDSPGAHVALTRALAILEANVGPDHPKRGRALHGLGGLAYHAGDYELAREHLTEMMRIWSIHGPTLGLRDELQIRLILVSCHRELGDLAEAESLLAESWERIGPEHADADWSGPERSLTAAWHAEDEGRLEEAARHYETALVRGQDRERDAFFLQQVERELARLGLPPTAPANPEKR